MSNAKLFFKGFAAGFRRFGISLSYVVNFILLFFVYFLGIGLTAIVARIVGKNFLDLKKSQDQDSYWTPLNLKTRKKEYYYRQF